jgi:hypothetical protein
LVLECVPRSTFLEFHFSRFYYSSVCFIHRPILRTIQEYRYFHHLKNIRTVNNTYHNFRASSQRSGDSNHSARLMHPIIFTVILNLQKKHSKPVTLLFYIYTRSEYHKQNAQSIASLSIYIAAQASQVRNSFPSLLLREFKTHKKMEWSNHLGMEIKLY